MAILLFILIALTILYFSHYFLYGSIVYFFDFTSPGRKVILALVLFLLPTSFVVAEIVARRATGLLARLYFFSSTLWLGLALTLMVFFLVAWVAWGATKLVTHSPARALFGWTAVALACLYSGYGVWNAYHPRTKEISIKIKDLPAEWRGRKIVQLTDIHLGQILGRSFLEGIVAQANAYKPDVVFVTGDLFDGADGQLDEMIRPLDSLQAPLGIYFVTGNHETYLGVDRAYAALRTTKAKILNDEMMMIDGLQIIGIAYPTRGFSKDIGQAIHKLAGFNPQRPSVLLYHNPSGVDQARAAGISLQLSGHTHKGQLFPVQIISRMIYGKYYNGLHSEGDYTIYTTSGAGTWGPTMRTGNHPEITVIRLEPL